MGAVARLSWGQGLQEGWSLGTSDVIGGLGVPDLGSLGGVHGIGSGSGGGEPTHGSYVACTDACGGWFVTGLVSKSAKGTFRYVTTLPLEDTAFQWQWSLAVNSQTLGSTHFLCPQGSLLQCCTTHFPESRTLCCCSSCTIVSSQHCNAAALWVDVGECQWGLRYVERQVLFVLRVGCSLVLTGLSEWHHVAVTWVLGEFGTQCKLSP